LEEAADRRTWQIARIVDLHAVDEHHAAETIMREAFTNFIQWKRRWTSHKNSRNGERNLTATATGERPHGWQFFYDFYYHYLYMLSEPPVDLPRKHHNFRRR
jgi:hypothetical protein